MKIEPFFNAGLKSFVIYVNTSCILDRTQASNLGGQWIPLDCRVVVKDILDKLKLVSFCLK